MNIAPDFVSYESVGKEVRDFCYQSESRHKQSPADQTAFRGHKGLWDVYCKRNKVSGEQDSPSTSPSMLTCAVFYKCPLASLCHNFQQREYFQSALSKVISSEG